MRTLNRGIYRDRRRRQIPMQPSLDFVTGDMIGWGASVIHLADTTGTVQTVSNGLQLSAPQLVFINPNFIIDASGTAQQLL